MKRYQTLILAALAISFASCEPEFENEVSDEMFSAGEVDFSSYVAIGNSLTAGFMDGTMYRSGQGYSFPNLLAKQFAIVGGGEFTQPSFADDGGDLGGLLFMGQPIADTRLIINMQTGAPENWSGTPSVEVSSQQQRAYHNMGVPGAKSFHLLAPGYGNVEGVPTGTANPYFARHATSANATVLSDAISMKPTFFTNWIGSNDVLAYALSGGTGVNQEGNYDITSYAANDITDPQIFASAYSVILDSLTKDDAKGVVATIPYVTSIPHFTTVKYNSLTSDALGGEEIVEQLNENLFENLRTVLALLEEEDRIQLLNTNGSNPLLIVDEELTDLSQQIQFIASQDPELANFAQILGAIYGQARHATEKDLFVLGAGGVIGQFTDNPMLENMPEPYKSLFGTMGVTFPLEDKYTLTPTEQAEIKIATDAFNEIIRNQAYGKGLAVVNMNATMSYLISGIRLEDGQYYTEDYFNGSNLNRVLFSLDGVHPNPRGYAFVANEIIRAINNHYKAKLPMLSVGNYPGVTIKASN